MKHYLYLASLSITMFMLVGCGQAGKLYLPPKATPIKAEQNA